jgi:hypothetical protein
MSNKQIYPSNYTERKVTASQYLTDFIMERIAKKDKKVLTYKYWNDPAWKKIFLRQLGEATKLLKEANCVAIMAFLRSVKGRNIYSLGLKAQILAGAKEFIVVVAKVANAGTPNLNSDVFSEDIIIEAAIESGTPEHKNPSISLWERLG